MKSVAFLCHSIQWLEKRAEETEKEEWPGPALPLDDFADALNRADQILQQNENSIFGPDERRTLTLMADAAQVCVDVTIQDTH